MKKHRGQGIIQEFVDGVDLRVQTTGGKVFAACTRVPANIVGDGEHSVTRLIREKNKKRAAFNPDNVIIVNNETKLLLKKQGLSLKSVPKKGLVVRLKKATNIGLGGDPIDVTEKLHSGFNDLIEKLSSIFLVKTFAVDFIVKSKSTQIKPKNAVLLELNSPCLWAHHHIAEGQKRNVAAAILDSHFYPNSFDPASKKYLID